MMEDADEKDEVEEAKVEEVERPEGLQIYDLRVEEYDEAAGKMDLVMKRFVLLADYDEALKKQKPPKRPVGQPLRRPGQLPSPKPPGASQLPAPSRPGAHPEPLKKK